MATVKFTYSQDLETVYRFLTDPEVVRRRSEKFGETDIQISVNGGTLTNLRKVQAVVPGFAKKLLSPVNTVTDVKAWNAAARTARLTVDIQGAPVKVAGDIRLVAAGSGCDYVVDFQVSCRIPFIGGQLEKYVTGLTEEGMRKEYEWNRAELDGAR
jgi:hypothetical protein